MTDNEIIKALECCNENGDCSKCPYDRVRLDTNRDCASEMTADALDLIKRQKAENERLKKANEGYAELEQGCFVTGYKNIRAEAIKEFLNKLIDISVCKDNCNGTESLYVSIPKARQVLKEMVGDTDAT